MKHQERYWSYYVHPRTGWTQVVHAVWRGDMIDTRRATEGKIFQNENQARRAASAERIKKFGR